MLANRYFISSVLIDSNNLYQLIYFIALYINNELVYLLYELVRLIHPM